MTNNIEEKIKKRYHEIMTVSGGYERNTHSRYHNVKASLIRHFLDLNNINSSSSKILEVGVGTGLIAVPLALQGYDIVGIDLSPDMLKVARERKANHKLSNLQLFQASGFKLPFPDNSFDAVYAIQVLHLFDIQERLELLNEMNRVLRENGIIITDFLNRYSHLISWLGNHKKRPRRYESIAGITETYQNFNGFKIYAGIPSHIWRILTNLSFHKQGQIIAQISKFPLSKLFCHTIFVIANKQKSKGRT